MRSRNRRGGESAAEVAASRFDGGYNCAQSVLLGLKETRGVKVAEDLVNACAVMTGGLGRSGCVCGALTGASIAIGLVEGDRGVIGKRRRAIARTAEFHDIFKKEFGSTCCRVLRKGVDYGDPKLKERCRSITSRTAQLLDDFLFESGAYCEKHGEK